MTQVQFPKGPKSNPWTMDIYVLCISNFLQQQVKHRLSLSSNLRPIQLQFSCVRFQNKINISSIASSSERTFLRPTNIRYVAEEEQTLVPEAEAEASSLPVADTAEQTVSVLVSPSDALTMFFQAERSMIDAAIPIVTKALEEVEGISYLKEQVREGIANVKVLYSANPSTSVTSANINSIHVLKPKFKGWKEHVCIVLDGMETEQSTNLKDKSSANKTELEKSGIVQTTQVV